MSTSFLTAVFLSLLVAIVTGAEIAWAPYDLTAVVKDAENGYCTLEIAWQPGECGLVGTSTVSVIHNGSVHNQTVKTAEGRATFEGCEYWSFYKIVLRAGIACLEEELHQFVDTGPGQPHRPKEVLVWASSSTANISIVEAPMPRAVSGYNLQLCRVGSEAQNECNPMRFINRTSTEVESYQDRLQDLFFDNFRRYSRNLGVQNTTIHDLVPESTYAYKVIPIIVDGTETYTGSAETGFFKTTAAEPPKIVDLHPNYEENNSTLSSVFTWTIVEPEFRVEFYLVSVEPCTEACSVISEEPMAMFSKLKFSKDIRLEITAIFSRGSTRKSASYSFKLRTPEYVEPIKSLEVAKLSPREAILAWPPVGTKSVYVIEVCPVRAAIKECTTQTLVSPKAHLIDDESGVLYDVQIKVRQENFTAEYFQGSLQMLEQDYETPQIVSMDPEEKLWDRVVYGVKASIVAKVSRFEIEACSKNKELAGCVHSRGASLEDATLPLGYFGTYDVELCAVYELPLDKEVRKCTRAPLDTIGTEPDAVQDISFSDVTSDSFHLEWTQPRNVPSRTDGSLEIFYEISTQTINLTSPRPSLEVTGLRAFTDYDVEIRAVVTYQTEQYRGRAAADSVQTDVGTPGLITNLHATQQNYSSIVILEWEDPADANGPLDFFVVEYGLKNPGTHFESVRVNRTRAEINLPVPQNDSVYVFRVSAGNVNKREKKELIGENSELEVNVRGIGLWFNVTVIDVTCNSVELRLNSSNDRKWVSNWFYIIVDSQNRHRNTTLKLVTIHGLETYHNETLRIKACYNDDYCTDELKLVVLTDVSAPSAVTDLKVSVSAGNSGNTLEMKWGEPEIKNGPVDGYVIELTDLTDSEVNMSFTVTDGTSFPFKSADEYETYKLSVRAFNNRVNPPHERVYGPATTKTKRSSGTHVPKVENLTISRVTDTEITVEWGDPIKDNRFNVTLFEVQLFDRNRTSERTQKHAAVIRDLQPYQNVSIGVRSCTGSLSKPDCGLPRMIRSKTDAAAPSPPRNLTVRILDEFTAIASWEAPEFPNGKINNYTLSMKNSTHLLSYYIDGHTLSYKLENLSPSETYVLTLTAGNFNNLSKRLDSKPAKSTFYTGKSSNLGVILMIVAVLATATLLVVGIVGWRSFRRRRLSSPPLIEDDQ